MGSNPSGAWISICCTCSILSVGHLCDGPIPLPEESYRLWCVIMRSRNVKNETSLAHVELLCQREKEREREKCRVGWEWRKNLRPKFVYDVSFFMQFYVRYNVTRLEGFEMRCWRGWRSGGLVVWGMREMECYIKWWSREISYIKWKQWRLTGLVTSRAELPFKVHYWRKERWKWREGEEEDISS